MNDTSVEKCCTCSDYSGGAVIGSTFYCEKCSLPRKPAQPISQSVAEPPKGDVNIGDKIVSHFFDLGARVSKKDYDFVIAELLSARAATIDECERTVLFGESKYDEEDTGDFIELEKENLKGKIYGWNAYRTAVQDAFTRMRGNE